MPTEYEIFAAILGPAEQARVNSLPAAIRAGVARKLAERAGKTITQPPPPPPTPRGPVPSPFYGRAHAQAKTPRPVVTCCPKCALIECRCPQDFRSFPWQLK